MKNVLAKTLRYALLTTLVMGMAACDDDPPGGTIDATVGGSGGGGVGGEPDASSGGGGGGEQIQCDTNADCPDERFCEHLAPACWAVGPRQTTAPMAKPATRRPGSVAP